MNTIDQSVVKSTRQEALNGRRGRANFDLHKPTDYLQRFLQVVLKGTYFTPHKHEKKLELFVAFTGKFAVLTFDDNGEIADFAIISPGGTLVTEVPPNVWHSVITLSPEATFFEIIEGYYDPATHKTMAPWAPLEGTEGCDEYLENLTAKLESKLGAKK